MELEEKKTLRFWENNALALAIGICGVLLVTQLLFLLGITITFVHFWVFSLIILITLIISYRGKIYKGLLHFGILSIPIGLSILISAWFYDLGGDGMGTHQEAILGLQSEWNPIKDPYFFKAEELMEKYPVLEDMPWLKRGTTKFFSYQLSAIIAKAFNHHESGKAINWIGIMLSFSIAAYVFRQWIPNPTVAYLVAFAWAFNPVSIYQSFSYWQDGFISSLMATLILISLWLAKNPRHISSWIIYFVIMLVLAGCKKSGIGFGALISMGLGVFLLVFHFKWYQKLILLGAMGLLGVLLLIGGQLSGLWGYERGVLNTIIQTIELYNHDGIWYGAGSFNQVADYAQMNRWQVLFYSSFSRSLPVAYEIDLMPLFLTDWQELRTFYYFFEDPRAGGYGPFFRTSVVLSLIAMLLYIWKSDKRFITLLGVFSILLPCLFLATYWARWIPQIGLLPMVMLLPAISREITFNKLPAFRLNRLASLGRLVPWVALTYAFLNSLVILVLYVSGNIFGTHMIRQQLMVVNQLEQPVSMGTGWYPSNRYWLQREDIPYQIEWGTSPYALQFYRTNTYIYIPEDQLDKPYNEQFSIAERLDDLKRTVNLYQEGQWLNEVWLDTRVKDNQ